MNQLQIDYFKAVAHYKNFTRAAEELYVSQPAVSKQIAALEAELGVRLFIRKGRSLELTLSGEVMYEYFVRTAVELENAISLARDLNGKGGDEILQARITFFIDWDSDIFVIPLLEYCENVKPHIDLEMENRGLNDIAASLSDARSDITICFDYMVPDQYKKDMNILHLADVASMVYFSNRHPLAKKEGLKFKDFRDELCIIPNHPAPKEYIRNLCISNYSFEPKFRIKQNHDSMLMSVLSGTGYCVLDEWSRNKTNARFRTLPLEHKEAVCAYWRKNNQNPAIPLLVEMLKEIAAK